MSPEIHSVAAPSIAARMERLPVCTLHYRFVALVSIGTWLDFFDLFMIGYLGVALQNYHFLTLHQFSELVASGFLGMFIGTVIQGLASDHIGRRKGFIIMLLLYSLFSVVGAFAPNAQILIAVRFLVGIGISGQQVVVDTYISEMVPKSVRGRSVAMSQLVGFTAVPVAAYISSVLVPTHWLLPGWRWVMLIGGIGTFFAWVVMHQIEESPRWLESRGRTSEAERIIERMEAEAVRATGKPLPIPEPLRVESTVRTSLAELFRPPYRRRTFMLMVFNLLQTVGFYGFANWAPTFILREGNNLGQSLQYAFLISLANPLGPLIGVWTAERLDRKRTLVGLSLLIAATGMAFAFARQPRAIIAIGALVTIFICWFSAVYHAYQAELFPTRARATGVGFCYSWSRLGGLFSTFIIGALLAHGVLAVFAFIGSAMIGVALIVAVFGPHTNSMALEKLSS